MVHASSGSTLASRKCPVPGTLVSRPDRLKPCEALICLLRTGLMADIPEFNWLLCTIVSGGQTGADRAALDWACRHRIAHGGWCPKGRLASDGPLPLHYQLREIGR